jgi:hypothetical protein
MGKRAVPYNPDEIVIYVAGQIMQGYADGEFLTIEQMTDGFQDVVGTDGEVAVSRSNDRRAKLTLKVLQTSLFNAVLTAQMLAQLNAPVGIPFFTAQVEDLSGGVIASGAQCWLTKWPDASFDRTAKSREWVLMIANADRAESGNVA